MLQKFSLRTVLLFLFLLLVLSTLTYAVSKEKITVFDFLSSDDQEKQAGVAQQIEAYQTLDPETALGQRMKEFADQKQQVESDVE